MQPKVLDLDVVTQSFIEFDMTSRDRTSDFDNHQRIDVEEFCIRFEEGGFMDLEGEGEGKEGSEG